VPLKHTKQLILLKVRKTGQKQRSCLGDVVEAQREETPVLNIAGSGLNTMNNLNAPHQTH